MIDLNFNTTLNFDPFIIPAEDLPINYWNLIPKDMINKDLLNFLSERGIYINIISSFYEEYTKSLNNITNKNYHETIITFIKNNYKIIELIYLDLLLLKIN